jgi:TetR/AcrR family transcriptional regulator
MASVLQNKRPRHRLVMEPALDGDRKWSNQLGSAQDQFELKRQAAIAQALRVFGRQGFKSTSLDEIAAALNVTKPALYYYFKDKQELLHECHKLSMDMGDQSLDAGVAAGGTGLEKILKFVYSYVTALTGELGASSVLDELDALKPEDRRLVIRRRRAFDRRLRALVEEGISDGSVRACDSKIVVFWFMGAIHGIPSWFRSNGEQTGGEIAHKFAELLSRALRP